MDAAYMAYRENRIAKNRIRRLKIVRMQRLALVAIIAILISLTIFLAMSLGTQAHSENMRYKYYTQITVNHGDTLESIACRYITGEYENSESYINEVCNINHLEDKDQVLAGESLIVPYYSDDYRSGN